MKNKQVLILLALLLVIPDIAMAASGILDTAQGNFQSATAAWAGNAASYAKDIFYTLIGIEMAWLSITWVISRKTFDEIIPSIIKKIMVWGFFLLLIQNAGTYMPLIINSFQAAGTGISGATAVTPSAIVDEADAAFVAIVMGDSSGLAALGVVVPAPATSASTTTAAGSNSGGSGSVCNPWVLCLNTAGSAVTDTISGAITHALDFILFLILAIAIWVSLVIVAFDLLLTYIESYVVLGVGVMFLGFGASRWTTKFADGILNYVTSVAVKMMVQILVIGVIMSAIVTPTLAQIAAIQSGSTLSGGMLTTGLQALLGALLVMVLGKSIPGKAQSLLGGGASLGAGHMAKEANTAGSVAMGGAALGMAAMGGAASLGKMAVSKAAAMGGGSMTGGGVAAAAGSGMSAAGQAAGKGVAAAGQAAGGAISAIPVPGVAQAAGAAVSAAGQAAGAGVSAAGQAAGAGVNAAGKAGGLTGNVATDVKNAVMGGGTSGGAAKAPTPVAAPQPSALSGLKSGFSKAGSFANSAAQHAASGSGGTVQASHISTSHGNE